MNRYTKQRIIIESKFNNARLTKNQKLALPFATSPLKVDRTTSEQLGNVAKYTTIFFYRTEKIKKQ